MEIFDGFKKVINDSFRTWLECVEALVWRFPRLIGKSYDLVRELQSIDFLLVYFGTSLCGLEEPSVLRYTQRWSIDLLQC